MTKTVWDKTSKVRHLDVLYLLDIQDKRGNFVFHKATHNINYNHDRNKHRKF